MRMRFALVVFVAVASAHCAEVHAFPEAVGGQPGSGGAGGGLGGSGGDASQACSESESSGDPPTNPSCDSTPIDCLLPSVCEAGRCQPRTTAPDYALCSNGRCYGGQCEFEIVEGCHLEECSKAMSVACVNTLTPDVVIQPYVLEVDPTDPILAGQSFVVSLSGIVRLDESLLDQAQGVIVGGLTTVSLIDLSATIQVRGGATGPDVVLSAGAFIPYRCRLDGSPCDPTNDEPSLPGVRGNTDCDPIGPFNSCTRLYELPTSDDCAPSGLCEMLDKGSQCDDNGFCITSGLPIELDLVTGVELTAAEGTCAAGGAACTTDSDCGMDGPCQAPQPVLFGWFETPAEASPAVDEPALDGDGTWNMSRPNYTGVAGPIGLVIDAAGTALQLECIMGVDSETPDAFGFVEDARPISQSELIRLPVQVPP